MKPLLDLTGPDARQQVADLGKVDGAARAGGALAHTRGLKTSFYGIVYAPRRDSTTGSFQFEDHRDIGTTVTYKRG